MSADPDRPAPPPSAVRRRRRRWAIGLGIVGAVGVFLFSAALVVWDGLTVGGELEEASEDVQSLRAQVIDGQSEAAAATLESLQAHAATADATTGRPHWWLMAHTPGVGPSVAAVRTIASVVDDLASDALPALSEATQVVNPATLAPRDGRIDLAPLLEIAPAVVAADQTVQTSIERLDAIDHTSVLSAVRQPVEDLEDMLADVAETTATASRAVQLLPSMLGAEGPRHYLLLVQNPAEIRASGGMPGAFALITADDGRLEFTDNYRALGYRFIPPLAITDEERNIYTDRLGMYMSAVTFTPDFPRTAELAREMVARNEGVEVDGVFSVDPVALQGVLGATAPVTLPDGSVLDGENAADVLMHDVYVDIDGNDAQDQYFADAARATFEALTSGVGSPAAAIDALATAAREGRLKAWSTVDEEQRLISGTVLSGESVGERDGAPVVGVYFNDGTATKLDYYLRYAVSAEGSQCHDDGTRTVSLDVTMSNTAPEDVESIPRSVLGGFRLVEPGTIRTNLMVYGPAEGWVDATLVGSFMHGDRHVVVKTVELAPGDSETFSFDVITGSPRQSEPLIIMVTPGAENPHIDLADYACGQVMR